MDTRLSQVCWCHQSWCRYSMTRHCRRKRRHYRLPHKMNCWGTRQNTGVCCWILVALLSSLFRYKSMRVPRHLTRPPCKMIRLDKTRTTNCWKARQQSVSSICRSCYCSDKHDRSYRPPCKRYCLGARWIAMLFWCVRRDG